MDPITVIAPELAGRALLSQVWADLVFLHWRVDPDEVAPLLPPGIHPDVYDGAGWVGLIPFRMAETAVLGAVPVPYFGRFTEINVRLYGVDDTGRRGVVFASLEASRLASVAVARAAFGLPYQWAQTSAAIDQDTLTYASRRRAGDRPATRISARRTRSSVTDDKLAAFLTARWMLFQGRGSSTLAMPNQHPTWRLFDAELLDLDDELVAAAGIRSIGGRAPDSVLYSPGVLTRFGAPARLSRSARDRKPSRPL